MSELKDPYIEETIQRHKNAVSKLVEYMEKVSEQQRLVDSLAELIKNMCPPPKKRMRTKIIVSNKTIGDESKKNTFEDNIVSFLSSGVPKTTGDIVEYLENQTGKKKKSSNVSSQLNTLCNSKGSIKCYRISARTKLWGLTGWFNNGQMKKEYFDKYKRNTSKNKSPEGLLNDTPLLASAG